MRVLVVTTWYPSRLNPVRGVFVQRQVEAIAERHDVSVVHLSPADEGAPEPSGETRPRVTVHHVPWTMRDPRSLVRSLAAARRIAASERPDVLHSMVFSALPHGFAMARAARSRARVPWVHSEHWSGISDPASVHPAWRAVAPAPKSMYRGPDVVTAVSEYLRQAIAPYARADRLLVVPNVVEGPARVSPAPDGGPLRLLAVGNLVRSKNPGLAVRALAQLWHRGVDAELRWVGTGPLESRVQQLAAALGMTDHLHLVGRVPPDQVGAEYEACQVFLLPTEHETFCVVAAEALLHGRPVVVGATGGQRDFVTPDVGVLVDQQTATAYADAVRSVRDRLGASDPQTFAASVRDRFSSRAVADGFDAAYRFAQSARH
jgi:glycosyltransferase involved in cell wall biosynthesis